MSTEYRSIQSMRLICVEKDTLAEIYACVINDNYTRMRKTRHGIWSQYISYKPDDALSMKTYSPAFDLFIYTYIHLVKSKTIFGLNEIQQIFNIPYDIIWYIKKIAVMSFINKKI